MIYSWNSDNVTVSAVRVSFSEKDWKKESYNNIHLKIDV